MTNDVVLKGLVGWTGLEVLCEVGTTTDVRDEIQTRVIVEKFKRGEKLRESMKECGRR